MKRRYAKVRGVHPYCFKCGEEGRIIGVEWCVPANGMPERLCYKVEFDDLQVDWVPVLEASVADDTAWRLS